MNNLIINIDQILNYMEIKNPFGPAFRAFDPLTPFGIVLTGVPEGDIYEDFYNILNSMTGSELEVEMVIASNYPSYVDQNGDLIRQGEGDDCIDIDDYRYSSTITGEKFRDSDIYGGKFDSDIDNFIEVLRGYGKVFLGDPKINLLEYQVDQYLDNKTLHLVKITA